MSTTTNEVIVLIIAVIAVILFLAILFLVTLAYHSSRRKQMQKEKERLIAAFENQILQSKLEMQEQTFHFISQEIHDNVGQVLSLAKVQLSILDEGDVFNRELIHQTRESVGKAMAELRDIAKSLNTERIQSFDLCENIKEELYRLNKTNLVRGELIQEGDIFVLSEHKLILFRIIQECIQNIVKHAEASLIKVCLFGNEERFHILIEDNGKGFKLNEVDKANMGLGLKNMKQRVALIGGELLIKSKIGEGTLIDIKIKCN